MGQLRQRYVIFHRGYGYGRVRAAGAALGPRSVRTIEVYTTVTAAALIVTLGVMNIESWSVPARLLVVGVVGGCFGLFGHLVCTRRRWR